MPSSASALVTGAAGFVGSQLVRTLVDRGDSVLALVRPGADLWRLHDVAAAIDVVERDLFDLPADPAQLGRVDVVYHLAAAGVDPRFAADEAVIETNVLGTWRVLELARALRADRFVYCGSCFEYGAGSFLSEAAPLRPRSAYAASKAAAWALVEAAGANGLDVVALRPFTVYGPYEAAHRLIPSCVLGALAGRPIETTSGEQRRDFVYVEDVAEAFLAAASAGSEAAGSVFNVCTGVETPIREAASAAAACAGSETEMRPGALPQRPGEAAALSGDPSRAAATLGFRATTALADGLERTVGWFAEHQDLYQRTAAA